MSPTNTGVDNRRLCLLGPGFLKANKWFLQLLKNYFFLFFRLRFVGTTRCTPPIQKVGPFGLADTANPASIFMNG